MAAPAAGPVAEARRLYELATAQRLSPRLVGGVAVALSSRVSIPEQLRREYKDLDFVVGRRDARAWRELLEGAGYEADTRFNALHGAQRLLHYDHANSRQLDTFVSTFAMCHVLELEERLPKDSPTLEPADILLTKLQIVQVNDKDLTDTIALLLLHPVTGGKLENGIDRSRLVAVAGADWGWHTTLSDNLLKVADRLATVGLDDAQTDVVRHRVAEIQTALDDAPKSFKWRARAAVGRRVLWYDIPDEVDAENRDD